MPRMKRKPVSGEIRVLGPDGRPVGYKPYRPPLVDHTGRPINAGPRITPIYGAKGERLVDPLRVSGKLMEDILRDPDLRLSPGGKKRIMEASRVVGKIRDLGPNDLQKAWALATGTSIGARAFHFEVWHNRLAGCIMPTQVANVLLELIALERKNETL